MAGPSRLLPHQYHFEADPEQESDDEEECSNDEEKRSNWEPLSNFRFSIDDWLNLYLDNGNASLIVNVRQKLHALIVRKFKTCGKSSTHGDDMVVQTIVQALCSEDQAALNISNFQSRMKLLPPSRKSNFRSDRNESSSSSEERNSSTPGVGGSSSRSSISSSPCLTPDMATVGQSVRYFVLKPPDGQMIDISLTTGSWFASHGTKRVLDNAYKSTGSVILFVSVQGSGHFQGFARMNTTSYNDQGKTKFGIEWLKRREVHFHEVNHLNNPWNDNKNVKISRDGQEIEPMVAQELIEIIERGNDKSRYAKGRNSRRGKKLH